VSYCLPPLNLLIFSSISACTPRLPLVVHDMHLCSFLLLRLSAYTSFFYTYSSLTTPTTPHIMLLYIFITHNRHSRDSPISSFFYPFIPLSVHLSACSSILLFLSICPIIIAILQMELSFALMTTHNSLSMVTLEMPIAPFPQKGISRFRFCIFGDVGMRHLDSLSRDL
jgi:hypothetical protein